MGIDKHRGIFWIKREGIIFIYRLGILVWVILFIPLCSSAKMTNLVDSKITREGDKVIYTGRVLWFKNNQPAEVRVMLIGTLTQLYDETITDKNGYYQLVGSKDDLLIMIQPVHTRRLLIPEKLEISGKLTQGALPEFILKITEEIEDVFPKVNYGYYSIITFPESKIVFEKDDERLKPEVQKAFLVFKKRYDCPGKYDEDVLNKECYECFDVAYAIKQYLFEKHKDKLVACYLCGTKIDYNFPGTPAANHVLTYAIFKDPNNKDKFYKVLFDGTPLNETLNPKVPFAIADIRFSRDSDFQQSSYKRSLKKGIPLKFIRYSEHRGFYILVGLFLHDGILEYQFTIYDISQGTQKDCLKVHEKMIFSYGFSTSRLMNSQEKFKRIKPQESINKGNLEKYGITYREKKKIPNYVWKECGEVIAQTFYWMVQKTDMVSREWERSERVKE